MMLVEKCFKMLDLWYYMERLKGRWRKTRSGMRTRPSRCEGENCTELRIGRSDERRKVGMQNCAGTGHCVQGWIDCVHLDCSPARAILV